MPYHILLCDLLVYYTNINTPSFLIYLGFRPSIAIGIFGKCQELHYATRITLMESVQSHVNQKWSENTHAGAVMGNTPLGISIMNKMGLVEYVIADVNGLWELTKQDPMLMNRYLNNESNALNQKTFENLTLADFVLENLIERMTKLLVLDMEVNENLG